MGSRAQNCESYTADQGGNVDERQIGVPPEQNPQTEKCCDNAQKGREKPDSQTKADNHTNNEGNGARIVGEDVKRPV